MILEAPAILAPSAAYKITHRERVWVCVNSSQASLCLLKKPKHGSMTINLQLDQQHLVQKLQQIDPSLVLQHSKWHQDLIWSNTTHHKENVALLIVNRMCQCWEKEGDVFIKPVDIPQLSTQTLSRGAAGLILATQPTWTTVYSLKVEVPRKWWMGFPLIENLVFPSASIWPLSVLILRRSHMLLSSDLQWRHSLHSPVNTGRTRSPGWRSVTPGPTLSTILSPSKEKQTNHYILVWQKPTNLKHVEICLPTSFMTKYTRK